MSQQFWHSATSHCCWNDHCLSYLDEIKIQAIINLSFATFFAMHHLTNKLARYQPFSDVFLVIFAGCEITYGLNKMPKTHAWLDLSTQYM